jgi:L-fuconolactonase
MNIDAHHHFWRYNADEYGWIDEAMSAIRRDFLPVDLQPAMAAADIQGAISVQARQSLEETWWLLSLAERHPFIRGVVGWLPLASPALQIPDHPMLKGVRHVVQAELPGFLDAPDFNRGVIRLAERALVYDLLILEHQLPETIRFVDRHPRQTFVLDHIAKPRIRRGRIEPWRTNVRELARRENVFCKLSGMVTEADYRRWTPADLEPYFDVVMEAFGPSGLMFGSDWPVCLVACEYGRWADLVRRLTGAEQAAIRGRTAAQVYRL